jgi:hypothetical protein
MINKEFRLLFLAVLSQCLADNIDDGIGSFKQKHKQHAKTFLAELLKLMDKDFGSAKAVEQLIELTIWLEDMFNVMMQMGGFDEEKTKAIQDDWETLLLKYEIKPLKR